MVTSISSDLNFCTANNYMRFKFLHNFFIGAVGQLSAFDNTVTMIQLSMSIYFDWNVANFLHLLQRISLLSIFCFYKYSTIS